MPKPKKRTHEHTAQKIVRRIHGTSLAKRRAQQAREYRSAHEMIQRHANMLAEHFSSVQIVATKVEPNGATSDYAAGSGDLHARVHMTGCWVGKVEGMYAGEM